MPLLAGGSVVSSVPENVGMGGMAQRKSRQEDVIDGRNSSIADDSDKMLSERGEDAVTEDMPEEALSYVLGL